MGYSIEIKDLTARPAAVVQFTAHVSEMAENMGRAFGAVMQHIDASGSGIAGPPFAYFEQLGNERFDVRAGFPVTARVQGEGEVQPFDLPGGTVTTTMHVGPYDTLHEAYSALEKHAQESGCDLDTTGPSWEEYLTGPEVPPEQTQTVIYWPVKRR